MRKALITTLTGVAVLSAGAWMRIDTPLAVQPESRVWVEGTSTTKSWNCKAPAFDAEILATSADAAAAVASGEKAVRSVTIKVASQKLDCGNGTMTGHAKKAIKADEHKTITFTLVSYDLAKSADGVRGTLKGTLNLGGVAKPVAIAATAKPAPGGQMRVSGIYPLKMSDYGLKAPSLMMGAMKVRDDVTVGFDLLLKAAPPAAPIP
jgi:polyisoprenoid-binding protein YceI